MPLVVNPDIIDPGGSAQIGHTGSGTITVTITGDTGDTATIDVPGGQTVEWKPPAGWGSATFNAPGCDEVFRLIGTTAAEG